MAMAQVRAPAHTYTHVTFSNKTLSFAYVMVEKNIGWFKQLLAYTLPINDDDPDTQQFRAFHTKLDGIKPR
jgi:hypothetical protein